jgi:AraC family transcriptional regulator of adaptative response/methylated-DNA-[protein]-cysteine methyltransferase
MGITHTNFKHGRSAERVIQFAIGECFLGHVLVARSERGICTISIGDSPALLTLELEKLFPNANLIAEESGFDASLASVISFIENPTMHFALTLDIQGTTFQQRVWNALQQIPVGRTVTYSEIAVMIGAPTGVRAVATACAANKLAVAIPCHRVVRSDGTLSGYRWGVPRKRKLLDRESLCSIKVE